MLVVDGEPLAGENLLESLENCKGSLSEANRLFLAGGHEQAGNERLQCSGKKCIVVLQGEAATADLTHEPGLVIGSEDATTCVIAVAECRNSGLVSAVHVDEGVSSAQTASHLLAGMSRPQIYLCGAYCDKESKGPKVASAILRHLHNDPRRVDVRLACLGVANTCSQGHPLARDLLFDAELRRPLRVRVAVPTRGESQPLPALTVRHARLWLCMGNRDTPFEVYDCKKKALVVPPFEYSVPRPMAAFFAACLGMDAEEMLKYTSTSPGDERPEFPTVQRQTFAWILDHRRSSNVFSGSISNGLEYRWVFESNGGGAGDRGGRWECVSK